MMEKRPTRRGLILQAPVRWRSRTGGVLFTRIPACYDNQVSQFAMIHLRTLNLNLLPALQAVLRTQNMTRTSKQLNMSQSAVSVALNWVMWKLREMLPHIDDETLHAYLKEMLVAHERNIERCAAFLFEPSP
jgi:hypothetical protein